MCWDQVEVFGIFFLVDLVIYVNVLEVGGDVEVFICFEWINMCDVYGLVVMLIWVMDVIFMYDVVCDGQVDVISVYIIDGWIVVYDLQVLVDLQGILLFYDVIILFLFEVVV